MKKIYLAFLLTIFLPFLGSAQFANIEDDSGWSFGLNMGALYQQSDSRDLPGFGWGMTWGKSVYHRPTRLLRYDLRLRGLWGRMYGENLNPSEQISFYNIQQNNTLHILLKILPTITTELELSVITIWSCSLWQID
jgi:hypothetical protein